MDQLDAFSAYRASAAVATPESWDGFSRDEPAHIREWPERTGNLVLLARCGKTDRRFGRAGDVRVAVFLVGYAGEDRREGKFLFQ